MDIKKIAIGTVVGGIVLYVLGFLIWEMLFADFFEANSGTATGVDREVPVMWAMILGTLIYAEAITFGIDSRNAVSIVDGAIIGAVIGIWIWGTADLIIYSLTHLNTLTNVVADIVLEGVRGAIAGAVVALVLSKVGAPGSAPTAAAD